MPVATFARWWQRFHQHGPRALSDHSRRPQHCPTVLPGSVLDTVRHAQRERGVGVRRLHAELCAEGTLQCSASSVYRILRRCGALVHRPRRPRPAWQRYAKEQPGERAQADLKYLPQGRFQLTLIDDCSRYLAATVLPDRTQETVVAALGRLLTAQLAVRGCRHAHIRPRTPHLNGKVERVQRTCAEECWDGLDPTSDANHWEAQLQAYVRTYNQQRLHSALGYTTPAQYAQERLTQVA